MNQSAQLMMLKIRTWKAGTRLREMKQYYKRDRTHQKLCASSHCQQSDHLP